MILVIQRVSESSVTIDKLVKATIKQGLLLLIGIETDDDESDVEWLVRKVVQMRIFSDEKGLMNLDVTQIQGEILVISQFTLQASTKKGNRPSYIKAARPERALPLYEAFLSRLRLEFQGNVESGEFGADMKVSLVNDGPVTIIIDSKDRK